MPSNTRFKLSSNLVKRSLISHSWLGLLTGALMYLVCFSGTLAVLYQEFERWEQPTVAESEQFDPAIVEMSYRAFIDSQNAETEHAYIILPRPGMPRTLLMSDNGQQAMNPDGSLTDTATHPWTGLLTDLHLFLHLPKSWGMIFVSALGAMLCALIVSGLFAHPRLFKDAFSLRLKGNRRLEQTDIHNRLSVWGLPFHLMIAITGAFFGLVSLLNIVIASAFFDGDRDAVIHEIYGDQPELQQPVEPLGIAKALNRTQELAPEANPIFVTVEHPGTPEQFMIIGAHYPDRLIYSEQYRFDGAGNYLDKVGFVDGEPGRQAIFSVYRLHFGHFGGLGVKLLYVVLGLALTVVSVTGINIWLSKRKHRDAINNLWTGLVWGTPLAFALTAASQVALLWSSVPLFWATLLASMALAQALDHDQRARRWLQGVTAAFILLVVLAHLLRFGADALAAAALWVNAGLVLSAISLAFFALRKPRH